MIKKLYKYRSGVGSLDNNGHSIFKRDVKTLAENKLYAPTVYELNDPSENHVDDKKVFDFYKNIYTKNELYPELVKMKEMFSNLGIYSLSKNFNNELLWAYYASGHRGFVIEYDFDLLYSSFQYVDWETTCHCIEVKYSNCIPKIKDPWHLRKLLNPKYFEILSLYLGNKSKNWKHEEEVRFILEGRGLIECDYRAVTAIYFGCRMEKAEIIYIMNKLKGRNVKYYKMALENNYKLNAVRIRDRYISADPYEIHNIDYDKQILTEEFLKDGYIYASKVKQAVEITCKQPLVKKVLAARVRKENDNITIEVIVKTTGIYFLKEFRFILTSHDEIVLMEDIERKRRQLLCNIKERGEEY